jgi:DNA-directed RNA polymerase specialized sigma24 family protein
MFFDGEDEDFCRSVISALRLDNKYKTFLNYRYVEHQSDKEIARRLNISPDYVNKQMNLSLKESYEALKRTPYKAFITTK